SYDELVGEENLFHDGVTYYFSARAIDNATNISGLVSSNGVEVDVSAPDPGTVIDGLNADLEWTNDATSLTASWSGFKDDNSAIDYYEYAMGSDSGGTDVISWTNVGMDSSVTRSGLSLQDGAAYTFSVRATDIMGNTSVPASTNGITLDITPPTVTELAPIEYSVLPVSETSSIVLTFSEIVTDLGVDVNSNYGTVDFTDQHSGNKLTVNILPPFASLDTVVIELKNITDRSGLVTEQEGYEFRSSLLADYNYDFKVDVEDLSQFVSFWPGLDLGPVTGDVPNFTAQLDGVANLRDVGVFTRMWHWSHGNTTILARSFPNVGDDIDVEQSPQSLNISIPDEALAGEVVVQYQTSSTDITLN
ncbi:MAG: fibronectin type III domain-containing protein, partial [Candidatus Marinimicrobia bacterium]|nr:fibronectin type III domain-containing protein [Candidatus Neomarinimicrobiota bacterium]